MNKFLLTTQFTSGITTNRNLTVSVASSGILLCLVLILAYLFPYLSLSPLSSFPPSLPFFDMVSLNTCLRATPGVISTSQYLPNQALTSARSCVSFFSYSDFLFFLFHSFCFFFISFSFISLSFLFHIFFISYFDIKKILLRLADLTPSLSSSNHLSSAISKLLSTPRFAQIQPLLRWYVLLSSFLSKKKKK